MIHSANLNLFLRAKYDRICSEMSRFQIPNLIQFYQSLICLLRWSWREVTKVGLRFQITLPKTDILTTKCLHWSSDIIRLKPNGSENLFIATNSLGDDILFTTEWNRDNIDWCPLHEPFIWVLSSFLRPIIYGQMGDFWSGDSIVSWIQ